MEEYRGIWRWRRKRRRRSIRGGMLVTIVVTLMQMLVLRSSAETVSWPAVMKLERKIPHNDKMVELNHLRERDRVRHPRILLSSSSSSSSVGVADFPVLGTFNPFLVGLYYTKLQLGTPPRDYYIQIDTGSDVLWVSCSSCDGCPTTSGLQIPLNFFDPGSSSTASLIYCSDQRCSLGIEASDTACSASNRQCSYSFQYGDGSGTSGYYVSDLMHFDTVLGGSVIKNSSASVIFGCSVVQSGELTKSDRAVDGIFGFGQQDLSIVSQLASQGLTPRAFSHCLRGDDTGGGILVLGQILEPSIVYTPLVPSQPHYNLNLLSISVNGQDLSIDPAMFSSSSNQGTIIDSGTTLAYLAERAYDTFVHAITRLVANFAQPVLSKGNQCYLLSSSVTGVFPQVSLNFAGGASMILDPQDYLIEQNSIAGDSVWCIGFQKISGDGIAILGDLVLKNKIVVYDIANQRIGWTNYDCSLPVNVSAATDTGKTEYVNASQLSNSNSQPYLLHSAMQLILMAFFIHKFVVRSTLL